VATDRMWAGLKRRTGSDTPFNAMGPISSTVIQSSSSSSCPTVDLTRTSRGRA